MTYAEKIVADQDGHFINSIGKMFDEDDVINLINQAMQAQAKACLVAAEEALYQQGVWDEDVEAAILNAEVRA